MGTDVVSLGVSTTAKLGPGFTTNKVELFGETLIPLEKGKPNTFDEVSPRRHAEQASAPILLIHGKDDTVVDFSQSTEMAEALKRAGKPHAMVVLTAEDHWLSRSETRMQMLEEALAFVKAHNPAD
ncbi:MAG: alpha/beta hydrolase family protein [Novosphingobium sp.]